MEKYIFLDVDGVLNGQHSFNETCLYPFYLNNLKELINKTNAKIILSSSWRNFLHKENNKYVPNKEGGYGDKLIKAFDELNLEIHDTTELGYSTKKRGFQIKEWLDNYADKEYKYIILDDDDDMLTEQFEYFIKTKFNGKSIKDEGLNENILNKAILLLEG